jgi:hypothetical protein
MMHPITFSELSTLRAGALPAKIVEEFPRICALIDELQIEMGRLIAERNALLREVTGIHEVMDLFHAP